jgi:hypothetical protein
MDEALSATLDAVAVGLLVLFTHLLITEDKPDGVTLADSLASDCRTLSLLHVVQSKVVWARDISLVSFCHDGHPLSDSTLLR